MKRKTVHASIFFLARQSILYYNQCLPQFFSFSFLFLSTSTTQAISHPAAYRPQSKPNPQLRLRLRPPLHNTSHNFFLFDGKAISATILNRARDLSLFCPS